LPLLGLLGGAWTLYGVIGAIMSIRESKFKLNIHIFLQQHTFAESPPVQSITQAIVALTFIAGVVFCKSNVSLHMYFLPDLP
jgi:hypothetical protein